MDKHIRKALDDRRELIEARANAVLDRARIEGEDWIAALGAEPKRARAAQTRRRAARPVAAYRDRYGLTGPPPLGAEGEGGALTTARARAAPGSRPYGH